MSDPTTVNPSATAVNKIINDAIQAAEKAADTAAETALDTAAPFFAVPVIKQITDGIIEEIVSQVGNRISIGVQEVGTFLVIDTQVSSEKSGISKELANIMIAEKSGDPNAIKAAIQAYAVAQSALTHDDGSAPPVT